MSFPAVGIRVHTLFRVPLKTQVELLLGKSPLELASLMAGSSVGFNDQSPSKDISLEVVISPTSPVESPAPVSPQLPVASLDNLSTVLGMEVVSSAVVGAEPGPPTPTSIAPSASEDEWAEESGSDGDQEFAGNASAFESLDSAAFGIEW